MRGRSGRRSVCLFTTSKAIRSMGMTPSKGIIIETKGFGQYDWCVVGVIGIVGNHLVCQINHFQDRETTNKLID